ncbi:phage tail spike protein [Bacillus gobiensis]|uniref:Tail spike domain-containing protein n=1 Tax=Bacillus gobiensis TaxID=1441095 RepID=A0A0M4FV24_9BACI|nr:phage tail spike protein [Bacillus gobiensis]ALC80450.1 hypothetical protein AM592_01770 [Bacillus gobiensis]
MIHVLHHQTDELVGWVDFALEDTHSRSLNEETFDFIAPTDADGMNQIKGRSRLLIPAEEGDYREFIVDKIYESRVSKQTEIYSVASYTDLQKSKVIAPAERDGQTVESAAEFVLSGLEWQVGTVEYSGIRKWTIEKHLSAYEALKAIVSLFECELVFRVTTDGDKVTGRYVDFLKKQGMNRGKEIKFGKDLIDIKRTIDPSRVVTALFCIGPEREDGTRLTVTVTNNEAFQNWNRKGQHLIEIYEPESNDQNMTMDRLKQLGETELKKRIAAAVNYEVEGASLEHILGYEHEITRIGDSAKIKDESFEPEIYLDSRVIQINRSIFDESKKVYTLGEVIEYEEEDVMRLWKDLQSLYATRVIKSPNPPVGKATIIWIKTGGPVDIPHSWDGSGWIPFSPLEAKDINAETPGGAQDKANNARDQANQYTDSQLENYVDAITYNQDLSEIQNQIDGNITSWFYDYEPSLMNVPASGWTTNDQKNNHLGDLFYNTSTGYSYRFTLEGSNYQWIRLTDNDVTKALSDASKAQDTADSKRRVFVNQPTPPYEVGDLWTQGNSGDIMRCQGAKAAGQPFSSADWSKASKYTDDSGAIEYTNDQLDQVEETIDEIEHEVSQRELSIIRQDNEPTGGGYVVGQLWLRTTNFTFHRWTGSAWEQLTPSIVSVDGKVNTNTYNQKVQEITQNIAEKAGLDYVNGQLVSKAEKANTYTKSDVDNSLNNKVSVTTYATDKNGIVERLDSAETSISQNESNISLKADKTSLDQTNRRLSEAEASISINSDAIALKANNSTVDSLAGRISTAEGQLNVQAGQIEARVTKSEFNNLSFGTRNYVYKSKSFTTGTLTNKQNQTFNMQSYNTEIWGKEITVSFDYKFSDDAILSDSSWFTVQFGSGLGWQGIANSIKNRSGHFTNTVNINNSTGSDTRMFVRVDYVNGGKLTISNLKIELGNRATDWTPAPEDIDTSISGINSRLSTSESIINQLSNEVNIRVKQSDYDIIMNDLTSRISSTEANLSVQAGQIAAKVEKNGVMSAILVSPESVKIPTSKLLVGDFTNLCSNPDFDGNKSADWYGLNWVGNPDWADKPNKYVGETRKRDVVHGDYFPVKGGDKFFVSVDCFSIDSPHQLGIGFEFQKRDGTRSWSWVYRNPQSSWATSSGELTVPEGFTQARIQIQQNGWDNFGRWWFTNVVVRRKTNTELIVNGSITTDALATDAVTADKINVSSLSAITANLGTVNAGTLNAVTLNGATGNFSGKLNAGNVEIEYGSINWRTWGFTTGTITYYEGVIDHRADGHDFHGWLNVEGSPVHTNNTVRAAQYTVYGLNPAINRMRRTIPHNLGFTPRVMCTIRWQTGCVSASNITLVYTENVNSSSFDIVVAGNRTFTSSEYIFVDVLMVKP